MTTTPQDDDALRAFAADPGAWGAPAETLTGQAAADYGRAVLQAAGVDIAELERVAGPGRPRIEPGGLLPKGTRSPRVNVSIPESIDQLLTELEHRRGTTRSVLVREALADYIAKAG
jgi:hypothetical protein